MEASSRPITSAQIGPHPDLDVLLNRHLAHPFRKPFAACNLSAFAEAMQIWRARGEQPLILDAGCGVGWSTLRLAAAYPDHFVLGVDQSLDRLNRGKPMPCPENAAFVRADLVDFWRLLDQEGIRLARHYLLYPNPWPKIGHLARRWHGHAVFPTLVGLGGVLECRSNWQIYVEELAQAFNRVSGQSITPEAFYPQGEALTPFEEKYRASGHALWRFVGQ